MRDEQRPTEAGFLKDVAEHSMTIVHDNGVHRHVRFRAPDTYNMGFDLVTYPGFLVYSGDMGTYVFSRLPDMFEFFRTKREGNDGLYINLGYWSEKVQAEDRQSGIEEYSPDRFRRRITEILEHREDVTDELRTAVEDEVLCYADEGEHEARVHAREFEYNGKIIFSDFWEVDLSEYTYRFIWCCYAISWGIRQYDSKKTNIDDFDSGKYPELVKK